MKNLKNKKGFTLVELLAVIVVLAIVMGLAVVAITGVLENARKATFVADAKQFLEGARNLVTSSDMNAMLDGTNNPTSYAVSCQNSKQAPSSRELPISVLKFQQGGEKSPYGNPYNKTLSKIYVSAALDTDNSCKLTYRIYLTDGVYEITDATDTEHGAVEWSKLGTDYLKLKASS